MMLVQRGRWCRFGEAALAWVCELGMTWSGQPRTALTTFNLKSESVASMAWLGRVEDLVVSRIYQGELTYSRHEKGSLRFAEMTIAGEIVPWKSGDGDKLARCYHPQYSRRAAGAVDELHAFVRAQAGDQQGKFGNVAFPHGLTDRAAPALQPVRIVMPRFDRERARPQGFVLVGCVDRGRQRDKADEAQKRSTMHGWWRIRARGEVSTAAEYHGSRDTEWPCAGIFCKF